MLNNRINRHIAAFTLVLGTVLAHPGVSFAASADLYSQPYLNQIHDVAQPATAQTPIVIAVIDQGIDVNHPDLQNNIWQGTLGTQTINGWDFITDQPATITYGPHGTEVAGVIKAVAGQSTNIKFMSVVACKVGYGCDVEKLVRAIYFAVGHGANVINLSVATDSFTPDFDQAISYAYSHNVVVVAAAGNANSADLPGQNLSVNPVSPICNDNGQNMILGVSSVSPQGQASPWANFGSCVDVYAPGENIYTLSDPAYNGGSFYQYDSGTSFAAPEASALAALILSQNSNLTARAVMDKVISNADKTSGQKVINVSATLNGSVVTAQATVTTVLYHIAVRIMSRLP